MHSATNHSLHKTPNLQQYSLSNNTITLDLHIEDVVSSDLCGKPLLRAKFNSNEARGKYQRFFFFFDKSQKILLNPMNLTTSLVPEKTKENQRHYEGLQISNLRGFTLTFCVLKKPEIAISRKDLNFVLF